MGGTKRAELCAQHAKEGMVDVINKRCGHRGCNKPPSHRVEGTKKAELYAWQHAREGMVDVVSKRWCAHHRGCSARPHFGMPSGARRPVRPEFFHRHAKKGVTNDREAGRHCAWGREVVRVSVGAMSLLRIPVSAVR